jgi:pilus assembly protein Flp/PilA
MGTSDRGTRMRNTLNRLVGDKIGATAIEYALIMALIMLAMVGGVANFGNSVGNMWNNISTEVLAH